MVFNWSIICDLIKKIWYDEYDDMLWLCWMWDHGKCVMMQEWRWSSYSSHQWWFVMKGSSDPIPNELMAWYTRGLVSYELHYAMMIKNDLMSFQKGTLA